MSSTTGVKANYSMDTYRLIHLVEGKEGLNWIASIFSLIMITSQKEDGQ